MTATEQKKGRREEDEKRKEKVRKEESEAQLATRGSGLEGRAQVLGLEGQVVPTGLSPSLRGAP